MVPGTLEELEADAEPERRFGSHLQLRGIPQEGSVHRLDNLQGPSSEKSQVFNVYEPCSVSDAGGYGCKFYYPAWVLDVFRGYEGIGCDIAL